MRSGDRPVRIPDIDLSKRGWARKARPPLFYVESYMEDLTPRQRDFVESFLKLRHGTKAAIAAGYSPNGADRRASKLLQHPGVMRELDARTRKIAAETDVEAQDLLRFWGRAVELDPLDVVDVGDDGTVSIKDLREITPETRRLIAEVEVNKRGVKLKFVDRLRASDLLGKAIGAFDGQPEEEEPRASGIIQTIIEQMRVSGPDELKLFRRLLETGQFRKLAEAVPVEWSSV